MTTFKLLNPFGPDSFKVAARCSIEKHPRQRGDVEAYSFRRADAGKELPSILAFINKHREPGDPPAEEIVATIGLAEIIFREAIDPVTIKPTDFATVIHRDNKTPIP